VTAGTLPLVPAVLHQQMASALFIFKTSAIKFADSLIASYIIRNVNVIASVEFTAADAGVFLPFHFPFQEKAPR
jgi:hypothetical protein